MALSKTIDQKGSVTNDLAMEEIPVNSKHSSLSVRHTRSKVVPHLILKVRSNLSSAHDYVV
jgi:hypothetical protein